MPRPFDICVTCPVSQSLIAQLVVLSDVCLNVIILYLWAALIQTPATLRMALRIFIFCYYYYMNVVFN